MSDSLWDDEFFAPPPDWTSSEDDDAPPTPAVAMRGTKPSLARVVASFPDGSAEVNLLDRTPTERTLLLPPNPLRLRVGGHVMAFPCRDGWCACDPAWEVYPVSALAQRMDLSTADLLADIAACFPGQLPGAGGLLNFDAFHALRAWWERNRSTPSSWQLKEFGTQCRLCVGQRVNFQRAEDTPVRDGWVHGWVKGAEAVVERRALPFPFHLPVLTAADLPPRLPLKVIDPIEEPLRLTGAQMTITADAPDQPYWLALRAIGARRPTSSAEVVSYWRGTLKVSLYGREFTVPPEELCWTIHEEDALGVRLARGRYVRVGLRAQDDGGVLVSLRLRNTNPWRELREAYPPGKQWRIHSTLSPTSNGLVCHFFHGPYRMQGFISDQASDAWNVFDSLELPPPDGIPVEVVAPDDDFMRLTLDLSPAAWEFHAPEPCAVIPVRCLCRRENELVVEWGPGLWTIVPRPVGLEVRATDYLWARVTWIDREDRRVALELLGFAHGWEVTRVLEGQLTVREDHGTELTIALAEQSAAVREGEWVSLEIKTVKFGWRDRTVVCGVGVPTAVTRSRRWQELRRVFQRGGTVSGEIVAVEGDTFIVDLGGCRGTCRSNRLGTDKTLPLDAHVGVTYRFNVLYIREDRGVVLSRKLLAQSEPKGKRRADFERLWVGQRCRGVITNLTDEGASVDLGGVGGFLRAGDMDWDLSKTPQEWPQRGQEIEVAVLSLDPETLHVSVGIRQLTDDPWPSLAAKYPPGTLVDCIVAKLVPFGVLVRIEGSFGGLIHKSEISWTKHPARGSGMPRVGQKVRALILGVDLAARKVTLSLRQVAARSWEETAQRYPLGTVVTRTIRSTTLFGAFLNLEEGLDAMIHVSEMGWTREASQPRRFLEEGDEVRAVVIRIDHENGQIALGIEPFDHSRWKPVTQKYRVGDLVEGEMARPIKAGVAVELAPDAEGLIHLAMLHDQAGAKAKKLVSRGRKYGFTVTAVDAETGRISVSLPQGAEPTPPVASTASNDEPPEAAAPAPRRWAAPGLSDVMERAAELQSQGNFQQAYDLVWTAAREYDDPLLYGELAGISRGFEQALAGRKVLNGRYRRIPTLDLGEGGTALVVPVYDINAHARTPLALKRLRPCAPEKLSVLLQIFSREHRILQENPHPHVVRSYRMPAPDALLFEWLPGRSLAREIAELDPHPGPPSSWWTLTRVLRLGRAVAEVFQHFNRREPEIFVHNDLAPSNLMVDRTRYPDADAEPDQAWLKLIDFGFAHAPGFHLMSGLAGHLDFNWQNGYRAPEVAREGRLGDPRVDMYSLGAILFHLLAGQLPCDGPEDHRQALARGHVPENVARAVLDLIAPDRSARLVNWQAVVNVLGGPLG